MIMDNHLLFIPDGNRRFGVLMDKYDINTRYLICGLKKSYELIMHVAKNHKDITHISLLVATADNIKRPGLLETIESYIGEAVNIVNSNQQRDQAFFHREFIGDFSVLSTKAREDMNRLFEAKVKNSPLHLRIFFNYDLVKDLNSYENYKEWSKNSIVGKMPDFNLIIRSGGKKRISNFCGLKLSYAEMYFLEELWPVLSTSTIDDCINDYRNRICTFGK